MYIILYVKYINISENYQTMYPAISSENIDHQL